MVDVDVVIVLIYKDDGRCSIVLIYTDDGRCSIVLIYTDDGRCSIYKDDVVLFLFIKMMVDVIYKDVVESCSYG